MLTDASEISARATPKAPRGPSAVLHFRYIPEIDSRKGIPSKQTNSGKISDTTRHYIPTN